MKGLAPYVAAALLAIAPANASWVNNRTLGFDPSKFGVPIYPGTSIRIGGATGGKDFSGRSQRTAMLETNDPVDVVASWYAAHWPGAARITYAGAAAAQFSKPWGTTAITLAIFRTGNTTNIRIVVPGGY